MNPSETRQSSSFFIVDDECVVRGSLRVIVDAMSSQQLRTLPRCLRSILTGQIVAATK